jgi:hypothetical protein
VSHSFASGTTVVMADGSRKPIQDIRIGDRVLASEPLTGKTAPRTVTAVLRHIDVDRTDVTVTDGTGKTAILHTTQHHLIWDSTHRVWTDAAQLKPSVQLLTLDGSVARPTAVRDLAGPQEMYDLTVDLTHTYYVVVGNTPVLVHNEDVNPFPDRYLPRDAYGRPIPDVDAAHSQLGRNNRGRPSEYNVAHEFDDNGRLVRQVHWSDHSDPSVHANPHEHVYDPVTGKRGGAQPLGGSCG